MSFESTKRFSSRVDDYVRYRPSYPIQIINFMQSELNLTPESIIVDVGSGTGISSELFLKNGNIVYGVEPNEEMRKASDQFLIQFPKYKSYQGSSHSTGLNNNIADFIICAQSFHWFDLVPTKNEFKRILKPDGWTILLWNDRRVTGSDFSIELEALNERYGREFDPKKPPSVDLQRISSFFKNFEEKKFYNYQELDYQGALGRLTSSSFLPQEGHPNFIAMSEDVKNIFEKYKVNDRIKIEYDTRLFFARWGNI